VTLPLEVLTFHGAPAWIQLWSLPLERNRCDGAEAIAPRLPGSVRCPAENRTRVRLPDSKHGNLATAGEHEAADFLLRRRACLFLGPYPASVT